MPKSKLRKDHKKKANAFKKRVEDRKKSFEKQMRSLYERQQQENLEKQMAAGDVSTQEIEGLNVEDFKMDTEEIPTMGNFGLPTEEAMPVIVEGVTSPDQL